MCSLKKVDGHPLRPFSTVEEHDETIIANWNKVVPKDARVYVLGDVAQKKSDIAKIGRLNGSRKILIAGNHDIFGSSEYLKYFKDIRATHRLDNGILMSHIPVHPDSKGRFRENIHGHTHYRSVMKLDKGREVIDPWYYCVCVEHTEYAPVDFEDVREKIKNLGV